jgi:hypothetical protein
MKRPVIIFFLSFIGICIVAVLFVFSFKNYLLSVTLNRFKEKINTKYHCTLSFKEASFYWNIGVKFNKLTLVPDNKDTLFFFENVSVVPSISQLLKGNYHFISVTIDSGYINLVNDSLQNNYKQFFKNDFTKIKKISYSTLEETANKLINSTLSSFPQTISITHVKFLYKTSLNLCDTIIIRQFNKSNDLFYGVIYSDTAPISIKGTISKNPTECTLTIVNKTEAPIPFIINRLSIYNTFSELKLSFKQTPSTRFTLNGIADGKRIKIFHPKLSEDTILINDFTFLFDTEINDNQIKLDSNSFIKINQLNASVYSTYNLNQRELIFKLNLPAVSANLFFKSLPNGIFTKVNDLEADGELSYKIHFYLPFNQPDSIKLYSQLKGINFKLKSFGKLNLNKLNSEFEYTAYEKDIPVKTFKVGPSNPDFVPLGQISPYIQKAILTSEDGGFFWHKGFNEEAFVQSISVNLKEKKFKRGGSTITMQLVKNVFLSRKKTVSRKLQELLITWLIENQGLCSKERMFEVYLNVIEFGPLIYGIKPACLFYFGKKPADVSLNEALFLSNLLPHPKWFKYSFDKNGQLKPSIQEYYKFMGRVMYSRKLISENEYNDLKPQVDLYITAKKLLDLTDNPLPDSLKTTEND